MPVYGFNYICGNLHIISAIVFHRLAVHNAVIGIYVTVTLSLVTECCYAYKCRVFRWNYLYLSFRSYVIGRASDSCRRPSFSPCAHLACAFGRNPSRAAVGSDGPLGRRADSPTAPRRIGLTGTDAARLRRYLAAARPVPGPVAANWTAGRLHEPTAPSTRRDVSSVLSVRRALCNI